MEIEQEVKEPADEAVEAPEADSKPEGWQTVDFQNDDREKIEARFNRVYGQLKRMQGTVHQLAGDNRALLDKMGTWEQNQNRLNSQDQINRVRDELKTAMDEGDSNVTASKVAELARLEGMVNSPASPQQAPQEQPNNTDDGLSEAEIAAVNAWAIDKNYMSDPNSDAYQWGVQKLNSIWTNPETADLPTHEKLRHMNDLASQNFKSNGKDQAAVLSGEKAPPKAKKGVKLSDDQKAVARVMFPDKNVDDAYKAYSKGMGI